MLGIIQIIRTIILMLWIKGELFTDLYKDVTYEAYKQAFPYVITKKVILKNVTTTSGKALIVSDNGFMFRDVEVEGEWCFCFCYVVDLGRSFLIYCKPFWVK